MSPARRWPDGTDLLVLELDVVRKKGIHAFMRPGLNDSLPQILQIGESLLTAVSIESGLYNLLVPLLGAAIVEDSIPEEDSFVAEELFALNSRTSIPLPTRQKNAAKAYRSRKPAPTTFRQELEKSIIAKLAIAIRSLTVEKLQRNLEEETTVHGAYIARKDLEEHFLDYLRQGETIFCFRGDAGTGKSTLARKLAAELAQTDNMLVRLAAHTEQSLVAGLAKFLANRGISTAEHPSVLKERFKQEIIKPGSPAVVLIDNVEDYAVIDDIMSTSGRTTFMLTSRYDMSIGQTGCTIVVGNMTFDQAVAMVRSRLPGVSDRDAWQLAEDLDFRPLAIEHACGFLAQEEDCTINEFCELVRENVVRLLDSIEVDDPTLTAIYRMTIDKLDERSLGVLDIVLAAGRVNVSFEFIKAVWAGTSFFENFAAKFSLPALEVRRGLQKLAQRSLVRFVEESGVLGGRSSTRYKVHIHLLTQKIFRELRSFECEVVHNNILALAQSGEQFDKWQVAKTLTIHAAAQAFDFEQILGALFETTRSIAPPADLAMLAALVVRGTSQSGVNSRHELPSVCDVRAACGKSLHGLNWSDQQRFRNFCLLNYELCHRDALWQTSSLTFLGFVAGQPFPGAYDQERRIAQLLLANDMMPTQERGLPGVLLEKAANEESRIRFHEAAKYYFAVGTIQFDLGKFAEALHAYRHAHRLWEELAKYDNYCGELCKVQVRLADCYQWMGEILSATEWRHTAVETVRSQVRQGGFAAWTYDHAANVALFRAANPPAQEAATDSSAYQDAQFYQELYAHLRDALKVTRKTVLGPAFAYYWACSIAGSAPREALRILVKRREELYSREWRFATDRYKLAELKIRMKLYEGGEHDALLGVSVSDFLRVARRFRNEELPHWWADALLTVYVLRRRYGCGTDDDISPDRLRRHLAYALKVVEREDRLRTVEQVDGDNFDPLILFTG